MTEKATLPITGYPKSMLTTRQQGEQRGRLMLIAGKIAAQLDHFIDTDKVKLLNGELVALSPARLQAMRLILERTIPTLSATEVRHKSALESMGTDALVSKLAQLVQQRPELHEKLVEAMGPKVIQATPVEVEGARVAAEKIVEADVSLD